MAKPTARDKIVISLKKEIEEQRKALESSKKCSYKTNLILPINSIRINLNVLDKEAILLYIAQLASVPVNLRAVGITDVPDLGGYSIEDWIHDLKNKYVQVNRRAEERRLDDLQRKLDLLLSEDVKKDNELADLMKSMGKKA